MSSLLPHRIETHSLGYPRIGAKRELKFALESYWRGEMSQDALEDLGKELRLRHWHEQSLLDQVPVGDFSFYDQVLDMSFMLGNVPERVASKGTHHLERYFYAARGRGSDCACQCGIAALEMTKWFDTNYHYIVPEFDSQTHFKLDASRLLNAIDEASKGGWRLKPVIIGPLTYLALGKEKDDTNKLDLLPSLLTVYEELLVLLSKKGIQWVQIDEPILVRELEETWKEGFQSAYNQLGGKGVNILLATYFGRLEENKQLLKKLPVQGIHLDAVSAPHEAEALFELLPESTVISLGVINGRNVWKANLHALLDWLEPLAKRYAKRMWIAPSCSLLHVPMDVGSEKQIDHELLSWLSFGKQKIEEIRLIAKGLNEGRDAIAKELKANAQAMLSHQHSHRAHNEQVKQALGSIRPEMGKRHSDFATRISLQQSTLQLPLFPTTTIGSFPQTSAIRKVRSHYKKGEISTEDYKASMQRAIQECVEQQEQLDIDVLVHGEAERNDMVEYFGEQLGGFAFTDFGWVQSYGSRCVKPPLLFGDVYRLAPMTVEWSVYAQSLTKKPMKGMLTGPVTILNWSFVRDDQPLATSCYQIALAIRDEVLDLQKAGIRIIQIDEAALREGLPLRRLEWSAYLQWAVDAFRISANGVDDTTQIHTHMCYSEFNDIIQSIAAMDADVITIETSRSDMELLDVFEHFSYPNQIGPGVYDIHSPNIPRVSQMTELIEKALERIPAERLWINPDCGLKTRKWEEVIPALRHMVLAARTLRQTY